MSFYTALTGLKGAQTDISTTSNNIANVGSNGFKKSRAEFGDIYGSTPLQAKSVGVGTMTKSITQQFSQGNLATSSNTLDMAISGQGFFALQAGGNASQTVYTRNGAFNVDDSGYIVDSNGQFLLGYPVDNDGSVSDKTLQGANKLKLDASYGDPKETTSIEMGVNLSSDSPVIAAGTIFDPDDPDTYSATSAVTIFDNAGNPQSATVFYIKTQDPTVLWIMMALFLIKPCKVPINSNLMPPTEIQKKLLALKWASIYLLIVLLLRRVLFLTLMTLTPIQLPPQ